MFEWCHPCGVPSGGFNEAPQFLVTAINSGVDYVHKVFLILCLSNNELYFAFNGFEIGYVVRQWLIFHCSKCFVSFFDETFDVSIYPW